jgi:hypothetical protein
MNFAAWAAGRMVVCGGVASDASSRWLSDCAAYDPSSDVWSPTVSLGDDLAGGYMAMFAQDPTHTAIWRGAIGVGVDAGAILDVSALTWEVVSTPSPSFSVGPWYAWRQDNDAVFWGGGGGARLDVSKTWTRLPGGGPVPSYRWGSNAAVWTGHEAVLFNSSSAAGSVSVLTQ